MSKKDAWELEPTDYGHGRDEPITNPNDLSRQPRQSPSSGVREKVPDEPAQERFGGGSSTPGNRGR